MIAAMLAQVFRGTRIWVKKRLLLCNIANGRGYRWIMPRQLVPFAMLLPAVLLIILLNILNSTYGIYLSFLDWNYFRLEHRFSLVGLKHYYTLLTDPLFYTVVKNTITWSVVVVPGSFLLGFYLALLLNEELKAKAVFRTIILMPWATPLVVVSVLWSFIFLPGIGPLNDLLFRLGMTQMKYLNWLGDRRFALPIVMGVQIWRWAPFYAITLLAGLQTIPATLYEAAEIDGAGAIERFRYITLPLLRPVASIVLLQGFIWSFHNFTIVFIMTEGGPANATELLTVYLWRTAFPTGQLAKAAAVGAMLISIVAIPGVIWVLRVLGREVTE